MPFRLPWQSRPPERKPASRDQLATLLKGMLFDGNGIPDAADLQQQEGCPVPLLHLIEAPAVGE